MKLPLTECANSVSYEECLWGLDMEFQFDLVVK